MHAPSPPLSVTQSGEHLIMVTHGANQVLCVTTVVGRERRSYLWVTRQVPHLCGARGYLTGGQGPNLYIPNSWKLCNQRPV